MLPPLLAPDMALPAASRLDRLSHTRLYCTTTVVPPALLNCRACMLTDVHGWQRLITGM